MPAVAAMWAGNEAPASESQENSRASTAAWQSGSYHPSAQPGPSPSDSTRTERSPHVQLPPPQSHAPSPAAPSLQPPPSHVHGSHPEPKWPGAHSAHSLPTKPGAQQSSAEVVKLAGAQKGASASASEVARQLELVAHHEHGPAAHAPQLDREAQYASPATHSAEKPPARGRRRRAAAPSSTSRWPARALTGCRRRTRAQSPAAGRPRPERTQDRTDAGVLLGKNVPRALLARAVAPARRVGAQGAAGAGDHSLTLAARLGCVHHKSEVAAKPVEQPSGVELAEEHHGDRQGPSFRCAPGGDRHGVEVVGLLDRHDDAQLGAGGRH
eukprot:scaffold4498_cov119-Isochrysis_galbana.AAC.30